MTGRYLTMSIAVLVLASAVGIHAEERDLAWAVSQAPANALVVAGARNLQGTWNSLKEFSGQADKMPDLLAMAEKSLPAGADLRNSAVFIVMPGERRSSAVIMTRIKAGASLDGQKTEGGIIKIAGEAGASDVYAMKMSPWVAMSDNKASIAAMSTAKMRVPVTIQQRAEINNRSLWAWVNTKALAAKLKMEIPKDLPAGDAQMPGANPARMADWALGLLNQVASLTAALDLKPETASLSIGLEYAPNSQLALLAASGMPIMSYKAGLPASDRMLFAGWGRIEWTKAIGPTKSIFKPLLDALVPESNKEGRKSLDDLWAIYDEWATALGNDVGFVLEPAQAGEGMYRMAETFAIKDPDTFRKLIAKAMPLSANLTKSFSGLGPMGGASPVMEMKTEYKPAAETIDGVAVDVAASKMVFNAAASASKDDQDAAQKMMNSVYGPEGMTMRMAVVGRTAVVSAGGKEAMSRAIKASKGETPDLSSNAKIAAAVARIPKGATFAGLISLPNYAHFAISSMERMMAGAMGAESKPSSLKEPGPGDLVTFSLRTQGSTQYFDLNIPQSEIKGMIGIFEQMTAASGMGGGRPRPQQGRGMKKGSPATDDSVMPPGNE